MKITITPRGKVSMLHAVCVCQQLPTSSAPREASQHSNFAATLIFFNKKNEAVTIMQCNAVSQRPALHSEVVIGGLFEKRVTNHLRKV
jgi:hypothetical protein